MKGTIKSLPERKSFCFIETPNGDEYFLHRQDFKGHWKDLEEDFFNSVDPIEIEFEAVESLKGLRAANGRRTDFPNSYSREES